MRICFAAAAALLVASGSVSSGNTTSSLQTARWLSLAGYCIFAFILLTLIILELFLLTKRQSLISSSRKVRQPSFRVPHQRILTNHAGLERNLDRRPIHHPPVRVRYPRSRLRVYLLSMESNSWFHCGICADGIGVRVHSDMRMAIYRVLYASKSGCGSSCERDQCPERCRLNGRWLNSKFVR